MRSSATPERVREIEEYVNSRIKELESSTSCNDPLKIAILALLNVAESYLDVSSQNMNRGKIEDERIFRLLKNIEDATK